MHLCIIHFVKEGGWIPEKEEEESPDFISLSLAPCFIFVLERHWLVFKRYWIRSWQSSAGLRLACVILQLYWHVLYVGRRWLSGQHTFPLRKSRTQSRFGRARIKNGKTYYYLIFFLKQPSLIASNVQVMNRRKFAKSLTWLGLIAPFQSN